MANPIRWFRKHRKAAFAILTLFTMFAFVFIPAVIQMFEGRGRGGSAVVLTTSKYGKLRELELQSLAHDRWIARAFLQRTQAALRDPTGRGGIAGQELLQQMGKTPTSDSQVVQTWLLARRAEELGMQVDDDTINDFITQATDGRLGKKQIHEILGSLKTNESGLFRALGRELLAVRLQQTIDVSIRGTTPAQRYDYFLRLNRSAKIEALGVPVENFVDKVPDPSDRELAAFFEKYKDRLFDPNSPEPGFREPHRVNVQFVKAEQQAFSDPKSVSEEEIRDYYEKNKSVRYRDTDLPKPSAPPTTGKTEPASTSPTPLDKPAAPAESKPEVTPATKAEAPKQPQPAPAAKPEPPKDQAKPAEKEAPKKVSENRRGSRPQPEDLGAAEGPGNGSATSSHRPASPFRLTAFADSPSTDAPAKSDAPAKADTPAKPDAPAKSDVPGPDTKPKPEAGAPAAQGNPAPKPKADAATSPVGSADPTPKSQTPPAKAESAPAKTDGAAGKPAETVKPEPKYIPLDKVREEIRTTLAMQKAADATSKVLSTLQAKLIQYHSRRLTYNAMEKSKRDTVPAPEPPDFAEFAKQDSRLKIGETGLLAPYQMQATDIGRSAIDQTSFIQVVYGQSTEYQAMTSQDDQGNSYLFWKTADHKERAPDWDDPAVREDVLRVWKNVEARQFAAQQADGLAAQARQAAKPLAQALPDHKNGIVPEPFAWMSLGGMPWMPMPRLSEVRGVEKAGMDFMRSVFQLTPGEVGLAWNQPQTIVYVVRLVELTPSDKELWDRFTQARPETYMSVAQYDWFVIYQAWMRNIEADAGLKWLRTPSEGGTTD